MFVLLFSSHETTPNSKELKMIGTFVKKQSVVKVIFFFRIFHFFTIMSFKLELIWNDLVLGDKALKM